MLLEFSALPHRQISSLYSDSQMANQLDQTNDYEAEVREESNTGFSEAERTIERAYTTNPYSETAGAFQRKRGHLTLVLFKITCARTCISLVEQTSPLRRWHNTQAPEALEHMD